MFTPQGATHMLSLLPPAGSLTFAVSQRGVDMSTAFYLSYTVFCEGHTGGPLEKGEAIKHRLFLLAFSI